ncbi:MAG: 5-(carboxyamino)imidazole ribonucleotide synthase [Planctomycetota bacterium]|nr:5-(carboxyamino)imidazole ribonucleotide synthase [Planctomycetota bacterium]
MFAIAARQMGYRVHTFSEESDTPTGQVADLEVTAPYGDLDAVADFARDVSVVTFEFENVPADTAEMCARFAPVRPGGHVLHTTQHRLREKTFLQNAGFPVTRFRAVKSKDDFLRAAEQLKLPCVLKTASFGYDGKGQSTVRTIDQGLAEIAKGSQTELIFEAFVDFECELSVVAARGMGGDFAHWGLIGNTHQNHILDVSIAPLEIDGRIAREAVEISRGILEALDVVGVLCVEFFLTRTGKLIVNELAPRPHNSGHLTIDACVTSQFEQQLRAVCGLPLGNTRQHQPAAMVNLLGDIWQPREPNWPAALALPGIKLHLYGKAEARPGRKMGHITALADTPAQASELALTARRALRNPA